jgi:hypothetical protein
MESNPAINRTSTGATMKTKTMLAALSLSLRLTNALVADELSPAEPGAYLHNFNRKLVNFKKL